jgi:tetratricopeptide (TPR) repeat protein
MRSAHISEIGPLRLRPFHFLWRPVRHALGVEAFGVNAYTQPEAGGDLIEEHDETGGGAGKHQELYVVLSGRATFRAGERELDAGAGTLVFFDDPAERRSAVAAEENTTVLAVGAPLGASYEVSPWEWYFRADAQLLAGDVAGALATMAEGVEQRPDNANVHFNAACYASLADEPELALGYLERALELDPGLAETVRTDPDLDPLRSDSRFGEILTRSAGG